MKAGELADRLWRFAARVGKVVDALPDTRLGRHVAGQLVRSGTAGPPNYEEGCAAESPADFVHKLSLSLKELKETRGWLRFIVMTELMSGRSVDLLLVENEELIRILASSVATVKGKRRRPTSGISIEASGRPPNDQ